jgi:hypothetical protein
MQPKYRLGYSVSHHKNCDVIREYCSVNTREKRDVTEKHIEKKWR